MALETTPWDVADYLTDRESIAAYLNAAMEDGNPELLRAALGDVARSKGMTQIANAIGLSTTSLCNALLEGGNPEFASDAKVLHALGRPIGARSAAP